MQPRAARWTLSLRVTVRVVDPWDRWPEARSEELAKSPAMVLEDTSGNEDIWIRNFLIPTFLSIFSENGGNLPALNHGESAGLWERRRGSVLLP